MVAPCPLIDVHGGPRERGRQYGEAARDRILLGVSHYREQLATTRLGAEEIRALVAGFVPTMADFDPAHVEEMRGIAEGAAVDFEAIVLLNARTEVLKLSQARPVAAGGEEDPDGCTGVVVMPEAAADGRLIHAQNWDWKVECAESSVVLRIARDDGPDILTFTEAGALARSGFNAAGVAITANYLECDRDYRRLGVPLPLIRRKVLEQSRLALAMRTVYVTPKSGANNMIVSHAGGVAIDFECAPDETFQVGAERGLIVHANHFQSPVALAKVVDRGIANMPDTLYRDLRVRRLLEPAVGSLTVEAVVAALADDFESPWSVCRPPRRSLNNNLSATVAMIVMEPLAGVMRVAMLPALGLHFTSYALDMAIDPPALAAGGPTAPAVVEARR